MVEERGSTISLCTAWRAARQNSIIKNGECFDASKNPEAHTDFLILISILLSFSRIVERERERERVDFLLMMSTISSPELVVGPAVRGQLGGGRETDLPPISSKSRRCRNVEVFEEESKVPVGRLCT